MSYRDLKSHIENPRPLVIDDLPRFLRGPYDPRERSYGGPRRCAVCYHGFMWRDDKGYVYDTPRYCKDCHGTGAIDPEAEADRELGKGWAERVKILDSILLGQGSSGDGPYWWWHAVDAARNVYLGNPGASADQRRAGYGRVRGLWR